MWVKKTLMAAVVIFPMVSFANGDLTLTVNGLDVSNSVEIEPNTSIIISVSGANDANENYSVTCQTGGALEVLSEPNVLGEIRYLFTSEDEGLGLTTVSLTVGELLDYQLVLFSRPDANTIVFGIDSDAIEMPEPAPEPEPSSEAETDTSVVQNTEPEYIMAADVKTDSRPSMSSYLRDIRENRSKYLMYCPADSNGTETFSKAAYEAYRQTALQEEDGGGMMLLDSNEPNVITIDSDITTNQLWTADNIYYIANSVSVKALLVIEPGTTVKLNPYCSLYVNDGGTLISVGRPDNPIIYTSAPGPPTRYFCAIYIEQTASPSTRIAYNYVEYADVGIATDNIRLDTPIENNYLFNNNFGIGELGPRHTDIINNLALANSHSGIDVYMASLGGSADANSHILIQNNTCDWYQYYGITIHGVDDANDAGLIMLINNIVTRASYYGLYFVDGYLSGLVSNTGYGSNFENKNTDFPEYNPVEVNENPYWIGPGPYDYAFLDQNCLFIDAGLQYIEETPLIGKTTSLDGTPDSNKTDLGFHNPNWNFSNAGTGFANSDINQDTITDFDDLSLLTGYWLDNAVPGVSDKSDLNGDGVINFRDFAIFSDKWLWTRGHPNLGLAISVDTNDINNITGSFEIDVNSSDFADRYDFVYMDGLLLANMPELGGRVTVDSYKFRNGAHVLKIVHMGWNYDITVSDEQTITFHNPVHCSDINDHFYVGHDYRISGLHDSNSILNVQITDLDEQVIWSDVYSGTDVNIIIPQNIFSNQMFCSLSAVVTGEAETMNVNLTKGFKPSDYNDVSVNMVIVLPDKDVFKCRKPAIYECAKACNLRNVSWVNLYLYDVTEENLQFLYNKSSVKYVYWCGHADSHVGRNEGEGIPGVQRTNAGCWFKGEMGWSPPYTAYTKVGVFSATRQTFPELPLLPYNWDQRGFDLCTLGMYNSGNKKIVFVDGCLSGKFMDMAVAYGMFSDWNLGHHDQIYIGWRETVLTAPPGSVIDWVLFSTDGVKLFWERMGIGDDVWHALSNTASQGSYGIKATLWGPNGLMDLHKPYDESDDNIWIYGEGIYAKLEP